MIWLCNLFKGDSYYRNIANYSFYPQILENGIDFINVFDILFKTVWGNIGIYRYFFMDCLH
jgi:hypothetical protein